MRLELLLRLAVAGAFVGHGAYGAILAKSSWFDYFGVLGIDEEMVSTYALMQIVGWVEIGLGLFVLVLQIPAVLLGMFVWKVFTELLRPAAGEPIWEFVERASNMVAPLALLVVVRNRAAVSPRGTDHQYVGASNADVSARGQPLSSPPPSPTAISPHTE